MLASVAAAQEAPQTDAASLEELKAQIKVMQDRLQSLETKAAAKPAPAAPAPPKKTVKLSYKDQRRLEECEALIAKSPAIIAKLEEALADPSPTAHREAETAKAHRG